jgi:hypothetical protein
MILSTVPGSTLPRLPVHGAYEPGSHGYRTTHRTGHYLALSHIVAMMRAGRSPADVAAYVETLGMVGASVSRAIEDASIPGTFGDAVFEILCG